jgi:hypothetical protein
MPTQFGGTSTSYGKEVTMTERELWVELNDTEINRKGQELTQFTVDFEESE